MQKDEQQEDEKKSFRNPVPQRAPGAECSGVKTADSSIPLSIFPIHPDRICICFCGLPGRGKTHISRRLGRYLSFFLAINVKIFNVGEYRRNMFGAVKNADWFDMQNEEGLRMREEANAEALRDMINFLKEGSTNSNSLSSTSLAIMDATNSTHVQRASIHQALRNEGINTIFVEVINEDPSFLMEQYQTAAITMPDYAERMSDWEAEEDYRQRIAAYSNFESLYSNHPVESRWSFVRCDYSKRHFEIHNIKGHIPLKALNFLMNIRTTTHSFYITRHGQSEYNRNGRIGGNSSLSEHGVAYAKALAAFVKEKIVVDENDPDKIVPVRLWTSTMKRTVETAQFIEHDTLTIQDEDDPSVLHEWTNLRMRKWPYLDEIFAGACDGMTYSEIKETMPEEFSRRQLDKLAYRYPRGESYLDVIARIEPMIIEMERHREPLLLIAHQGILRIIYAFYKGLTRDECPYVKLPLHAVIRLQPAAVTCSTEVFNLHNTPNEKDGQDEPT